MNYSFTKQDYAIFVGTLLDHYNTALYGFLAPILGPLFFPHHDPTIQLLLSYSLLTTSLIARPVGVLLFSTLAATLSPGKSLSYSLLGLATTAVLIGCIPSYHLIGTAAPLILIMLKLIHELCAAGENTIAKLYLMENKPAYKALKASHLYNGLSMLGILLASSLATLIITYCHEAWRLCFWLGGSTGIIGLLLRYHIGPQQEHTTITSSHSTTKPPILAIFWHKRTTFLSIAITTGLSYITYAIPFVFMNSFVPLITTISLESMMALNTALLVIDMFLIYFVGHITVNYTPKRLMGFATMTLAVSILPLFYFLPGSTLGYVTLVRIWIVFWGIVFLCPLNVWLKSLCSPLDQYFLIGMGSTVGTALMGRQATPLCLWLWYQWQSPLGPALYILLIALAATLIIWQTPPEKRRAA